MYRRIYRLAFPEKQRALANKYNKKRETYDPMFKLQRRIRSKIYDSLKRRFQTKHNSSVILLGCSISEYHHYIQNGFLPGMCWENYGKWHIDHKHPISSFDLSTLDGQKAAFHYTNTQPLWAVDNLRKSDRVL